MDFIGLRFNGFFLVHFVKKNAVTSILMSVCPVKKKFFSIVQKNSTKTFIKSKKKIKILSSNNSCKNKILSKKIRIFFIFIDIKFSSKKINNEKKIRNSP